MTWNGSGTYSLPAASFPEVNGTTIDATRFDATLTDVQNAITACLAKNGENAATANLPMGSFKHTGVGDGAAAGQYLAYGQATAASLPLLFIGAGAVATPSLYITGDANTGMWAPAADTLAWSTGGVERLRLDSSGNFGIGRTATARLDVAATDDARLVLDGTGSNANSGGTALFYRTGALLGSLGVQANRLSDSSTNLMLHAVNSLGFYTGAGSGTLRVTIDSSGNVGIAQAPSGTYKLEINGTVGAGNFQPFGSAAAGNGVNLPAANTLGFFTASTLRAQITSGGVFQYDDGITGMQEVGWRSLPPSTPADTSTLVVGMRSRMVVGNFTALTVPANVFARGDVVVVYQDSASSMTLTQGASLTLRLGGTTTTGSRTLAGRGFATITFNSATEAIVTGSVS